MIELLKTFWRKKFVIIAIVALTILVPMAATRQSTVLSRSIVTAMAINYSAGEYTVYTEVLIFNFDPFGVPEREVHHASALTIEEALIEIGENRGRRVSLSHCSVIVLGQGFVDSGKNLQEVLMPLFMRPDLNNSAAIFYSVDDLEELLMASAEQGDARSAMLQQIAEFNQRNKSRTFMSLEKFIKQSLEKRDTIILPEITKSDGEIRNEDVVKIVHLRND